jgi:hypothetical protein
MYRALACVWRAGSTPLYRIQVARSAEHASPKAQAGIASAESGLCRAVSVGGPETSVCRIGNTAPLFQPKKAERS